LTPVRLLVGPVVAGLLLVPTGCGGGSEAGGQDPPTGGSAAYDAETCVGDAAAVASTPDDYPASFPLPDGTVVFHVEDRGEDGVIATGVTATPFADVLAAMNAAQKSGFAITSGETEEDDAEANWTGQGYVGRWAIKKSAACPGETVIQLLSKKN
jgi:hypothetical protein